MRKKLPSFTIVELAVTLMISSVVLGMVYYVYMLFNRQFIRYRERSGAMDELVIFQKALQTDLERADAVTQSGENSIVCYTAASSKTVQYQFNNDYILRSVAEDKDSFRIPNKGYQAIPVNDSLGLVEELVLNLSIDSTSVGTTYKKQYSACQLMKQDQTHE